ncbi:MAG: Mrp/NBP35 family ATP-binding protein [Acidobacteria bacterium]|nr:Mrp/NBP35 family ATP-binding protein [Acidobacteriota bacterium]
MKPRLSHYAVREALRQIKDPVTGRNLEDGGFIRQLEIDRASVRVLVTLMGASPAAAEEVENQIRESLEKIEGVEEIRAEVRILPAQTGPELPQAGGPQVGSQAAPAWAGRIEEIRHVIAVASGKGGVGKSTVAANLAIALAGQGRSVGLLDADIYGPSQQMMMGGGQPLADESGKIYPVETDWGVKVISLGHIIEADQPVIWRGPLLMKALEQFFSDVVWGKLDELIVDLPPGTGDVAITLCQNVPMTGAVIVTTPQDVALIDARKGLAMFTKMDVPVLGIIENMSFYECPSCHHVEYIFGRGGGEKSAKELGVPYLGGVPIDPAIVSGGDAGKPIVVEKPDSAAAKAFEELASQIIQQIA